MAEVARPLAPPCEPEAFGFAASAAFTVLPPEPLGPEQGHFIASEDDLSGWAERAGEGDWCIYARAAYLPKASFSAALARRMAARWMVTLPSRRCPSRPDLWEYLARRTAVAFNDRAVYGDRPTPRPRASADVRREALSSEARRVLDLLARRADDGAHCPSNREIARACALRDADAAAYQIRVLVQAGLIVRHMVPLSPGRIVTIVETGRKTGVMRP